MYFLFSDERVCMRPGKTASAGYPLLQLHRPDLVRSRHRYRLIAPVGADQGVNEVTVRIRSTNMHAKAWERRIHPV